MAIMALESMRTMGDFFDKLSVEPKKNIVEICHEFLHIGLQAGIRVVKRNSRMAHAWTATFMRYLHPTVRFSPRVKPDVTPIILM